MSTASLGLPATIKALKILHGNSGIGVVDVPFATRREIQHLGPDGVLVKVRAIGLNSTEYVFIFYTGESRFRTLNYLLQLEACDRNLPTENICGSDGAGDVVAVGVSYKMFKK